MLKQSSMCFSVLITLLISNIVFAQDAKKTAKAKSPENICLGEIEHKTQVDIYRGATEMRNRLSEANKEHERRLGRLRDLERRVYDRYVVLTVLQDELANKLRAMEEEQDGGEADNAVGSEESKAIELKEIRAMAQTFEKMKPAQAAGIIEAMDEDLVVKNTQKS